MKRDTKTGDMVKTFKVRVKVVDNFEAFASEMAFTVDATDRDSAIFRAGQRYTKLEETRPAFTSWKILEVSVENLTNEPLAESQPKDGNTIAGCQSSV